MNQHVPPPPPACELDYLLSPWAAMVLDMFRCLADFEERYDLSLLDDVEARLARTMGVEIAKSLVSDALLLSFSLRTDRRGQIVLSPRGSRRATLDEMRLHALISAAGERRHDLAVACARVLGLKGMMMALGHCESIADQFARAGCPLDPADPRLLLLPRPAPQLRDMRDRREGPPRAWTG